MRESNVTSKARFYICPTCFKAAKEPLICHDHEMMPCHAESVEDCKPLLDAQGGMQSRAPRWFVEGAAEMKE